MTEEESAVEIVLDPEEFARVMRELKDLDKTLATGIRKAIRDGAKLIIGDVQDEIRSYPSRGRSTGMRDKLARSLAVRIGTARGGTKQGVFIVSTGRLLPENKKALVKAMNRASFRHPVFPTREGRRVWAEQDGMRYFRQSVVTRREAQMQATLRQAVADATAVLNQ